MGAYILGSPVYDTTMYVDNINSYDKMYVIMTVTKVINVFVLL